jgi:hypothetical protein
MISVDQTCTQWNNGPKNGFIVPLRRLDYLHFFNTAAVLSRNISVSYEHRKRGATKYVPFFESNALKGGHREVILNSFTW